MIYFNFLQLNDLCILTAWSCFGNFISEMQGDIVASDLEHEVDHSALADKLNKLSSDYADLQQLVGL